MPGAFNAGIVYRLSPRTTSPSMLRPRTASAKHYLLTGPPSPAAFLAARALVPRPTRAGSTSTPANSNVTRASHPKGSNAGPRSLPSWS